MNRSQIASARHHTYLLVSRIFKNGLSADLLPYARKLPELAAFVPEPFEQDEVAARHCHLFGHDIMPYESIFRDASGLLGGRFAAEVNWTYRTSGVDFPYEGDHFGQEIAFLAALCGAESAVCRTVEKEAADYFAKCQSQFLNHHLLLWLLPFLVALESSGGPFYAALGRLTLSLIGDHWQSLARSDHSIVVTKPHMNNSPELLELIRRDETNLKTIAGFLVTPPLSGFYLSLDVITNLARENRLPRGFGGRHQIMTNLLFSAAQYELLPDVLLDLSEICRSCDQAYRRHAGLFPGLKPYSRPWIVSTEKTRIALHEMIKLAVETPSSA